MGARIMPQGIYKRSKEQTKKLIERNKAGIGRKLSHETKKKMSLKRKGRKPMLGKKHTKKSRESIAESLKETLKNESILQHYSESRLGEKNSNWKGGRMNLKHCMRATFKYRQWRYDVFTRDKFKCQDCGDEKGGNLHAHHIKTVQEIFDEFNLKTTEEISNCEALWDINNGVTLCKECHYKLHNN